MRNLASYLYEEKSNVLITKRARDWADRKKLHFLPNFENNSLLQGLNILGNHTIHRIGEFKSVLEARMMKERELTETEMGEAFASVFGLELVIIQPMGLKLRIHRPKRAGTKK